MARHVRWGFVALVVSYVAALLAFRPATPFEWDEVLFLRSLDHFDVAAHSPHPPGYPVYVALARILRVVLGDPFLSLQTEGVLAAGGAVWCTFLLVRRLGGSRAAAMAAAGLLATVPGLNFWANTAMSDVVATAAGAGATLLLVRSMDDPRSGWQAATATALALGVRPQLAVLVAVPAVGVAWVMVRRRAWRSMLVAAGVGVATSGLIWVPAILITGAGRFFAALADHRAYWLVAERRARLPMAPLGAVLDRWLASPFGGEVTAAVFWCLLVLGVLGWVIAGRSRLVVTVGAPAVIYLAWAMFAMNLTTAARYALPALPFLAVLAAGVVTAGNRAARWAGAAGCIVCGVAGAVWFAPLAALRQEAAPTWDAVAWAREKALETGASIVYDPEIVPHAQYLLAGTPVASYKRDEAATDVAELREHGDVLLVGPRPEPGTQVLHSRTWLSGRLARLTRGRYATAAVCRVVGRTMGTSSPGWQPAGGRWVVGTGGSVRLPPSDDAGDVRIWGSTGALVVRRAGAPALILPAGAGLETAVFPGPAGAVDVAPAPPDRVERAAIELSPLSRTASCSCLADGFIIPLAAHLIGEARSDWRTDVLLANPQPYDLALILQLLPSHRENSSAVSVGVTVPARRTIAVRDVLSRPEAGGVGLAALVVRADPRDGRPDRRFAVLSRTRNLMSSPVDSSVGEGLPGVPFTRALASGQRAEFRIAQADAARRTSVGFVAWSRSPLSLRVRVRAAGGQVVEESRLELAPFEHRHEPISLGRGCVAVEVELSGASPGARSVVYLSGVDQTTGAPVHRLPDAVMGAAESIGTPEFPTPRP